MVTITRKQIKGKEYYKSSANNELYIKRKKTFVHRKIYK